LREDKDMKFINEDLTAERSKLLYHCRQLVKSKQIKTAYTFNCRIFIKEKADGEAIAIVNYDDLDRIKLNLPPPVPNRPSQTQEDAEPSTSDGTN
jgi:hypothetical protein